jgi:hypothetical protein
VQREKPPITLAELEALIAARIAADEPRAPRWEGLCAGLTLKGEPCTRQPGQGGRYCYLHGAPEEQAS